MMDRKSVVIVVGVVIFSCMFYTYMVESGSIEANMVMTLKQPMPGEGDILKPGYKSPSVSFKKAGVNQESPAYERCNYNIPELDGPCENDKGVCDGQRKVCWYPGMYHSVCDKDDYEFNNPDYEDGHEITCDDGLDNDCDGTYDFPSLSPNPDVMDCQEGPSGDYFVSKTGDNSDGLNWNTAFNDIQTVFDVYDIEPGDVIVVGEGTYYETVEPDSNDEGSLNSNVVLKVREGDEVLIDGQGSRKHGFDFDDINYFTIQGFSIDNHQSYSILLSDGIGNVVKNCNINMGLQDPVTDKNRNAIILRRQKDVTIEYNIITTDDGTGGNYNLVQTDGVYIGSGTEEVMIKGNLFDICNPCPNNVTGCSVAHNDCVQGFEAANVEIKNNYCYHMCGGEGIRSQGYFLQGAKNISRAGDRGKWKIHNNLGIGYWGSYGVNIDQNYDDVETHVHNNIIINYRDTTSYNIDGDDVYIYNNIGVNYEDSNIMVITPNFNKPDVSRLNNNIYYAPLSNSIVRMSQVNYDFNDLKNAGYELDGLNVDPLLDANLKPNTNSEAVDAGTNLPEPIIGNLDYLGIVRPQSSSWDIGAYEQ
jgi:hypothetical protein